MKATDLMQAAGIANAIAGELRYQAGLDSIELSADGHHDIDHHLREAYRALHRALGWEEGVA